MKKDEQVEPQTEEERQIAERQLQSAWNAFFELMLNKKDEEKKD